MTIGSLCPKARKDYSKEAGRLKQQGYYIQINFLQVLCL